MLSLGCSPKQKEQATPDPSPAAEPVTQSVVPSSDWIMGRYDPAERQDMVPIDVSYADREGLYMHTIAYEAFKKMHAAAQREGVDLIIRSALRPADYQRGIWERKWTGETLLDGTIDASTYYKDPVDRARAILRYSSMPGTSRHHWGTDIDLNAFENSEFYPEGDQHAVYQWLVEHALEYGFCQVYSVLGEDRPSGYQEERWHWSYIPIADRLTRYAAEHLTDDMITGFKGAETAPDIKVIENYVLGISPVCRIEN